MENGPLYKWERFLETSIDKTDWHFVGSYEPLLFCHDLVSHWKAGKLEWGDAIWADPTELRRGFFLKPPKLCWYMGYDQNFSSHSHISTLGKFDENWGSKIHPMEILWVFPRAIIHLCIPLQPSVMMTWSTSRKPWPLSPARYGSNKAGKKGNVSMGRPPKPAFLRQWTDV